MEICTVNNLPTLRRCWLAKFAAQVVLSLKRFITFFENLYNNSSLKFQTLQQTV
ncbi:hypothetical protein WN55_10945 [Dufourea novaeangliae]|uniref:Uncharacterized protein n=1 Tax=Dufourea novaeangliae TaxID=178035 RepID=A0A154P8M2_DUFNO|nr:hypothetical protein WN55_10945 [Dufourea novaeangliae]